MTCIVVNDVVAEDGEVIEDTDDWLAQAKDGTVHYCGELARDFEYFEGDDKIDMYLYGTTGGETDLDSLGGLPIYTPQGSILPLDSIATIRETVDTNSIRRINAQRTVTLNIIPPASIALEDGVEIVRNDVVAYLRESGGLPAR